MCCLPEIPPPPIEDEDEDEEAKPQERPCDDDGSEGRHRPLKYRREGGQPRVEMNPPTVRKSRVRERHTNQRDSLYATSTAQYDCNSIQCTKRHATSPLAASPPRPSAGGSWAGPRAARSRCQIRRVHRLAASRRALPRPERNTVARRRRCVASRAQSGILAARPIVVRSVSHRRPVCRRSHQHDADTSLRSCTTARRARPSQAAAAAYCQRARGAMRRFSRRRSATPSAAQAAMMWRRRHRAERRQQPLWHRSEAPDPESWTSHMEAHSQEQRPPAMYRCQR